MKSGGVLKTENSNIDSKSNMAQQLYKRLSQSRDAGMSPGPDLRDLGELQYANSIKMLNMVSMANCDVDSDKDHPSLVIESKDPSVVNRIKEI